MGCLSEGQGGSLEPPGQVPVEEDDLPEGRIDEASGVGSLLQQERAATVLPPVDQGGRGRPAPAEAHRWSGRCQPAGGGLSEDLLPAGVRVGDGGLGGPEEPEAPLDPRRFEPAADGLYGAAPGHLRPGPPGVDGDDGEEEDCERREDAHMVTVARAPGGVNAGVDPSPPPREHPPPMLRLSAVALAVLLSACAAGPRIVQDFPPASHKLPATKVRFDWHVEDHGGEEFVGYRLQVARDEDMRQLAVDRVVETPPVDHALPPGRWFWRVQGRYRTVGDRIRETPWSDVHFSAGRFVSRPVSFEALPVKGAPDAPQAPDAPAVAGAGPAKGKAAPAGKGKKRRRRAPGGKGPKVVPAHDLKPPLDAVRSLSLARVHSDGEPNEGLTREVLLRLYKLRNLVLLEGSFQRSYERAAPQPVADGEAPPKEQEREQTFVLDQGQPTPVLPPGAVRIERPDAVLLVRFYTLDVDPAALPHPPGTAAERGGFDRFEEGVRVLNATLVEMTTGQVSWTTSLYARPGISDLTLIDELVRRYFR